jgi:hypothetical protein
MAPDGYSSRDGFAEHNGILVGQNVAFASNESEGWTLAIHAMIDVGSCLGDRSVRLCSYMRKIKVAMATRRKSVARPGLLKPRGIAGRAARDRGDPGDPIAEIADRRVQRLRRFGHGVDIGRGLGRGRSGGARLPAGPVGETGETVRLRVSTCLAAAQTDATTSPSKRRATPSSSACRSASARRAAAACSSTRPWRSDSLRWNSRKASAISPSSSRCKSSGIAVSTVTRTFVRIVRFENHWRGD